MKEHDVIPKLCHYLQNFFVNSYSVPSVAVLLKRLLWCTDSSCVVPRYVSVQTQGNISCVRYSRAELLFFVSSMPLACLAAFGSQPAG